MEKVTSSESPELSEQLIVEPIEKYYMSLSRSFNDPFTLNLESKPSSPEKLLLTAILERAVRDLGYTSYGTSTTSEFSGIAAHNYRRDAVRWFTEEAEEDFDNFEKHQVTYAAVKDILELCPSRIKIIETKVERAVELIEEYHKVRASSMEVFVEKSYLKKLERNGVEAA